MPFRQIHFYFCSLPRSFQLTLWGFEYFRIPVLWVDSPLLLFCDVRCSDNPMLILDIVYLKTICGQTHVNLTSDYSCTKQNISFWNLLLYDNKWKWKSFFHWFSISEFRKKMFIFCSITAFTNKLMVWPWVLSLVLFLPTFFLAHRERSWLANCNCNKSLYFSRYIDNCFVIFRSPNHVRPFQDYLNSQHPNISFTMVN